MQNTETNSANSANQPSDTADNDDILAGAIARRRIDAAAIAGIAKLVAKNLTESEACRRLGIQPRAWFNFKDRAGRGEKFKALLEAYRADRIEHLIGQIEKSANGIGVKYPDFRAALALLKITDQKRFGDSPTVENTVNQTPILIAVGGEENLRKMVAMWTAEAKAQVAPSAVPKQIADAVEVEPERVK